LHQKETSLFKHHAILKLSKRTTTAKPLLLAIQAKAEMAALHVEDEAMHLGEQVLGILLLFATLSLGELGDEARPYLPKPMRIPFNRHRWRRLGRQPFPIIRSFIIRKHYLTATKAGSGTS
jgi:hypothetical protein